MIGFSRMGRTTYLTPRQGEQRAAAVPHDLDTQAQQDEGGQPKKYVKVRLRPEGRAIGGRSGSSNRLPRQR